MANSHLDPVLLSAYLDDEVSTDEHALVESHLATCEACQLELDSLSWTVNLLQRLPEEPLPRTFYITEAMLEPEASPSETPSWLQWLRSLLSGRAFAPIGAAVVALLLLMVIIQSQPLSFSPVSEPEIAQVPLPTAEIESESEPAIAAAPELLAMVTEEPMMAEAEIAPEAIEEADVAETVPSEAQSDAEIAPESYSSSMVESESESAEENEAGAVLAEAQVEAEPQSGTFLDAAASADADAQSSQAQPKESVATRRPSQARAAATRTATAANSVEPLATPTLALANRPNLLASATSETVAEDTNNDQLAPSASFANEESPKESTQASPTSEPSTQTYQIMLIGIVVLLLLIIGVIVWRKSSDD